MKRFALLLILLAGCAQRPAPPQAPSPTPQAATGGLGESLARFIENKPELTVDRLMKVIDDELIGVQKVPAATFSEFDDVRKLDNRRVTDAERKEWAARARSLK